MRPHGTSSRYTNNGCRCDDCRAAWAARMRVYQRQRRAKYRVEYPPKPPHRKIPQAEHPAIVERIRAGETLQAVAADYHVSREAIRQIVLTIDPNLKGGRLNALAEIARLRAENEELRALVVSLTRLVGGELIIAQPSGVAS